MQRPSMQSRGVENYNIPSCFAYCASEHRISSGLVGHLVCIYPEISLYTILNNIMRNPIQSGFEKMIAIIQSVMVLVYVVSYCSLNVPGYVILSNHSLYYHFVSGFNY